MKLLVLLTSKVKSLANGDLPTSGQQEGDVWKTADDGKFYAWSNGGWVELPGVTALKGEKGEDGANGTKGDKGD